MPRLVWLVTFLLAVPAALTAAIVALVVIAKPAANPLASTLPEGTVLAANTQIYGAYTGSDASVNGAATAADGRALIIKDYLHQYESPLEPFAADLVTIGDK